MNEGGEAKSKSSGSQFIFWALVILVFLILTSLQVRVVSLDAIRLRMDVHVVASMAVVGLFFLLPVSLLAFALAVVNRFKTPPDLRRMRVFTAFLLLFSAYMIFSGWRVDCERKREVSACTANQFLSDVAFGRDK